MDSKVDERALMLQAYVIAKQSPDPSTQNCAMLVDNNGEIICGGLNAVPNSLLINNDYSPYINDRDLKYDETVHAEVNAICTAALNGVRTKGLIMFAPWAACKNCAKTIIAAGIKELWTHNLAAAHNQWNEEVKKGLDMIKRSGIELHIIDGILDPTGKTTIRRNYEDLPV